MIDYIYVVAIGYRHEGGRTQACFDTFESAYHYALQVPLYGEFNYCTIERYEINSDKCEQAFERVGAPMDYSADGWYPFEGTEA